MGLPVRVDTETNAQEIVFADKQKMNVELQADDYVYSHWSGILRRYDPETTV